MNPIPDKSSAFQNDGSYRIFHVSSRAKDESDDEVEKFAEKNLQVSGKDEGKRRRFSKKSFRLSHRGGFVSGVVRLSEAKFRSFVRLDFRTVGNVKAIETRVRRRRIFPQQIDRSTR